MRIAICVLVSLTVGVNLRADEKLSLEDATLILEALQQKYRSLSCDHLRESNVAPMRTAGQYFQAENGWIRGVCKRSDAFDTDTIIKNNVHSNYRRFLSTIEIRPASSASDSGVGLVLCDAWEMAGMKYYVDSGGCPRSVACYLADRTTDKQCARLPNGDIVVTGDFAAAGGIVGQQKLVETRTFSKAHDYLFESRVLVDPGTGSAVFEAAVQSYVHSNGLFFPKSIASTNRDPDKRLLSTPDTVTETVTFSNVSVNGPIPLTMFDDHVGEPGTSVLDTTSRTVDNADSNDARKQADRVLVARADAQSGSAESARIWVGVAVAAAGAGLGIGIMIRRPRDAAVK